MSANRSGFALDQCEDAIYTITQPALGLFGFLVAPPEQNLQARGAADHLHVGPEPRSFGKKTVSNKKTAPNMQQSHNINSDSMSRHTPTHHHPLLDYTKHITMALRRPTKITSLVLFHAALIVFSIYAMLWTPTVLPANAPAHQFSEIRALHHVAALASYERQVSTAGVERAATYIHDEALRLARLAADTRPDLVVEVLREQTSGAVGFELFGASLTNIYHNITNIAVRVSTASSTTSSAKAFLINAHFDSTLGSSGASDCASCVGIALEALRALVQGHQQPRAPVVFLLNGGEETFMQGAAGFASSSAWRDDIGAFFNLESTGTHGLPILFQHTASWAVDVYARSAPAPRGTALSQVWGGHVLLYTYISPHMHSCLYKHQ